MDTVEKDTIDATPTNTKSSIDSPVAPMPVVRSSEMYNMKLKNNRGIALIIAYSEYEKIKPRKFAKDDVSLCERTFQSLEYEVKVHLNLHKRDFLDQLDGVSKADHSESDSLVIIFMGHGGVDKEKNKEYLETFDERVDTVELWKNFTPDKCPSLSGKPKMFFIQACRGDETDKGFQLENHSQLLAPPDTVDCGTMEQNYAIPLYADLLMMWASSPGMVAFNSFRHGINGSVFLHFLCQILNNDAEKDDLSSMLLRITRLVATYYESNSMDKLLDKTKQIPQTVSTLMRKVYFFGEGDADN